MTVAMTQSVNVISCVLRRDGQHMITYRAGAVVLNATSPTAIKAGTDVRVHDGKVVA